MFTHLIRYFLLGAGIWIFALPFKGFGQIQPRSQEAQLSAAVDLLESRAYREALEAFRELEARGADDPLLDYYLGRALQLNYRFEEAMGFYRRFGEAVSRQERRDYRIDQLMETCMSARDITSVYNPCEVMNVTFIDLKDSAQFSQIKMKGGQLQYKPAAYLGEGETRTDLTSLMFLPSGAVRGEYAYFSGYKKNHRDGAQLFRIRKGAGNSWGEPEELRELNTGGDELLPYFDPIERDLYFASDGRKGVGGFDLYRSHYDPDRDVWSEPMNMGFPINSVADEFLLLPGTDLGMLMFFSNRQGPGEMLTVYRVHVIEPKKSTGNHDPEMLAEIASFEDVAKKIQAELEALKSGRPETGQVRTLSREPAAENAGAPETSLLHTPEPAGTRDARALMLDEALHRRAMADSLRQLAVAATVRIRESDDPNDRWVWQKQIMLWEKKSRDEEAMADSLFAQLELQHAAGSLAGAVPSTLQVDTVIDELTVYRFSDTSLTEGEPGTAPPATPETTEPEQVINRFEVMEQSPYSGDLPVPMDVPLPAGTFYRIQVGVFSSEQGGEQFRGLMPITGEREQERGLVRYYAGKFSRYADASAALQVVREKGFRDAFIVAWYNGDQIPTHTAKQLE